MTPMNQTDELLAQVLWLQSENNHLRGLNSYLQNAVDLLSLPRVTLDDVQAVRDGLLLLRSPSDVLVRK